MAYIGEVFWPIDRSKVSIKPIQAFFHNGVLRWGMARVKQHVAPLGGRNTQKSEEWILRRVHWEHDMVAAIEHKGRHFYAWGRN